MTPDEFAEERAENSRILGAVLCGTSEKLKLPRKTCAHCGTVLVSLAKPRTLGLFVVRCPACRQDVYMVRMSRHGTYCHCRYIHHRGYWRRRRP